MQWGVKGSFKGVSSIFQGSFKGASRKINWCSEKPLKKIQGRFKVSKTNSKSVLWEFQRRVKKVSRVFKESVRCVSRKFHKKSQGCFKNVSMKFCFSILLLHGSHRSYPSRRRACLLISDMIMLLYDYNDTNEFINSYCLFAFFFLTME